MSEFNELYEHLKQCVDSDNDSYIGVTEQGVEFNMFEWAFGLAVKAKAEHDKLQAEKAELIELVKSSFMEGYSLGYGDGNSDGQSYTGHGCRDDEGQWKDSDSIELLNKLQ